MSKLIKIEQLSEEKARWEKYSSEKLLQRETDVAQDGSATAQFDDPAEIVAEARAEAERISREAFESGFAQGREEGLEQASSKLQTALSFLRELAHSLKEAEQ